jgi:integrase
MKSGFRVKEYKHDRYKFLVRGKVAGKWQRRYFATKGEANTYAQQQNTLLLNEGRRGVEFPAWLRLSAERAYEALLPWGKTIEDALHFYVTYLERAKKSAPLNTTVDELIEVRKQAGMSARYCYDLKLRLGRFGAAFSGKTTADISTAEIDSWLAGLGVAAGTRNTFRRDVQTLFSFCVKRGYCAVNPVIGSQRAKDIGSPIGILTPGQLSDFLEKANPSVVPYIAIGAFAGLRAAEIERLDWSEVNLADGHINVTAKNSKTATRRLVDVLPNLSLWLVSHIKPSGPVVPRNLRPLLLESRANAKIENWPPNALRHSFASYHLARFKDAANLALQLGHSHERMLFQHYREIVKPADAKRYWEIEPPTAAKIVSFKNG